MVANISDKAAIAGIGSTEFSKNSGRSELSLAIEACKAALDDAGLTPKDVDGMVTFTMDTNEEIEIARGLGCDDLTFYGRVPYGGGAATGTLHQAVMAVATGMAECVVCYRALNGRSGFRYSDGVSGDLITGSAIHYGWYTPYGLLTPASWVATYTMRYMHLYGIPQDALFEVAHSTREYAVNNPAAFFYQRSFTREEYDQSKVISSPLRLFDCCQESDGGSAVIVTTPERARDLRQPGVLVKGVAQCAGANMEEMTSFYRPEIACLPEMDHAARMAYEQCGLGPDDIDSAVIYDAFSSIVLWQLESWGFCGTGEAGDFVLDGSLRPDGRLPTNTHGGQLSEAYIHGVNGIVEAVRQVRGTSVNQPYLGASMLAEEIVRAVERSRPLAVGLSIVYPGDDPQLPDELRRLRRLLPEEVAVLVGGRAAPSYREVIGEIGATVVSDLGGFKAELDSLRERPQAVRDQPAERSLTR